MIKCTCTDGREITEVERVMAEAEGLDVNEVHDFMDTWTDHADRVISAQP